MPLPVIASSEAERKMLHELPMIRSTLELAAEAKCDLCGYRRPRGGGAALHRWVHLADLELKALQKAGAVGEIVGWAFDKERLTRSRVSPTIAWPARPFRRASAALVIATAMGSNARCPASRRHCSCGGLSTGFITDEAHRGRALLAGLESPPSRKVDLRGGTPPPWRAGRAPSKCPCCIAASNLR